MKTKHIVYSIAAIMTASAQCEEVSLQLYRPERSGQVSGIVIDVSNVSTRSASQPGQNSETQSESETVHFQARREVLAIDDFGVPTRVKYTVKELSVVSANERNYPVLRPGQVLVTELSGGGTKFIVDGVEAADSASFNRLAFFNLSAGGNVTDDQLFGTSRRRPVGEKWRIELDPETRAKLGWQMAGAGSHAIGKIDRIERVNGIDCAVFTKIFHFNNGAENLKALNLNPASLPPGTTVKMGSIDITGTALYPMDRSLPQLGGRFTAEIVTRIEIPQPNNQPVTVDWKVASTRTVSMTFGPDTVLMESAPAVASLLPPQDAGMAETYRSVRPLPAPAHNQQEWQPAPPPSRVYRMDPDRTSHIDGYLGSLGMED